MTLLKAAAGGLGLMLALALLTRRRAPVAPPSTRRERLEAAYREAANDPAYQAEMDEIDRAVGDGLDEPVAAGA